ncbi:hypothetical protein ODS41_12545 [Pyrobaculum sp. 3827-6]|uniref:hypothetical protein n=1 Tax=Pyrobaculum sp. 3827-6 TaxID=2983604 RepID=UPI0021D9042F|nr:hypothetical protein [Pyrobaculum sp. 3827-6]MCU7788742.1 hypothetical protein [Pyrobaculum sp. 3827-6]
MTEGEPVERAQAVEEVLPEDRRRVFVILLLGAFAVLGLFFGASGVGGGGGGAPAALMGVGLNGTQIFWLEAPRGSVVFFKMPLCNLAESPAAVWARVVEVPPEVRVFAVHVDGSYFGVRWGNWSEWRGVVEPRRCIEAVVEVVVDAKTPLNKTLRVVARVNSTLLGGG